MKKHLYFLAGGLILSIGTANSQCNFTGLNPIHCANDAADILVGSGSGAFSGPGVVGNTFDPALAGPGTHVINYDESDPTFYTIDQTGTFGLIAGTGTAISLSDDMVSGVMPIGFSFNFFGVVYTDFYVSSNGFLTFNNDGNSACCSGMAVPNASSPNNFIAYSWDDMYPPGGGTYEYFTTGTAPNQKLVINFFDINFCCSSGSPVVKTQLVLFEGSNRIEIHTEYANGVNPGTMGIENVDGTLGYVVTGRNGEAWANLTNDYVAFVPAVCNYNETVVVNPLPDVNGMVDSNPICSGDTVIFTGSGANTYVWSNSVIDATEVVPSVSGEYIVTGTESVNGCSNTDTVDLVINNNPTISLSSNDEMFGNDGSVNLSITGGIAPFTFDWDNDGTGDNNDNNDLYGVSGGTYSVTMTDGTGCTATASITVGSQLGLEDFSGIEFSIQPNPSNGIFQVILAKESDLTNVSLEIINSLGQKILNKQISTNSIDINISSYGAGAYYLKLITEKGTTTRSILLK